MDRQAKFKTQTYNEFFPDSMADRLPVVGTSSRGSVNNLNNVFSSSPNLKPKLIKVERIRRKLDSASSIIDVDISLLRLGKEKYDIHCSICHGDYGNGLGVLAKFGVAPRNLSDFLTWNLPGIRGSMDRWVDLSCDFYGSASGIMLGLSDRLTPKERWGIVLYVRALLSVRQPMPVKGGS